MSRSAGIRMAVTAVLLGIITAAAGCEWGTVPIEATLSDYSISVSPDSETVAVGLTVQLTATVVNADGDTLTVKVEWASTNPAIAAVDVDGLVTGVSKGSTEIVATYSGRSAKADIQVE